MNRYGSQEMQRNSIQEAWSAQPRWLVCTNQCMPCLPLQLQ